MLRFAQLFQLPRDLIEPLLPSLQLLALVFVERLIFARAALLPAANAFADPSAFLPQCRRRIRAVGRGVGFDSGGVDRDAAELSQTELAGRFHDQREDVVERPRVPPAKLVQRPEIGLEVGCQKAKTQVFAEALFDAPRRGQAQGIGVEPDLEHHRGRIGGASVVAIVRLEGAQTELLDQLVDKENQVPLAQLVADARRQQPVLVRCVGNIFAHNCLDVTPPCFATFLLPKLAEFSHRLFRPRL